MEKHLDDLLEELGNAYPETPTYKELKEKQFPEDTLQEALKRDLIIPSYDKFPVRNFGTGDRIGLSVKGYEYLNQIRIKKTIEQLNVSIKKFNESSDKTANILVGLTALLGFLALLSIPPNLATSAFGLVIPNYIFAALATIIVFCNALYILKFNIWKVFTKKHK